MNFENFLNRAWTDHAKDAEAVVRQLQQGAMLIEKNEQIPALASLATHVFGEHLGMWNEGILFLQSLQNLKSFVRGSESEDAVARSLAILKIGNGEKNVLSAFSNSDQIRILSVTASALSAQKKPELAQKYFKQALGQIQLGITKEDPANRALAVTGNNLACALEETAERSESETELMILAAKTGRKFWEIAGGWKEILWGEYRLSMTYLNAGDYQKALEHAQTCIEVAKENNAGAMELFFGYEALAHVEKSRRNQIGYEKAAEHARECFAQLSQEQQTDYEETLRKI